MRDINALSAAALPYLSGRDNALVLLMGLRYTQEFADRMVAECGERDEMTGEEIAAVFRKVAEELRMEEGA